MIFRNRMKNPKTMMLLGMLCLAMANVWPRFLHLGASLGPDWIDAIRGVLFGLGIGLSLMAAKLNGRRRRGDGCSSCGAL